MAEKLGKYTILLPSKPSVIGFASVVGKAEGEGPLSKEFDKVYDDDTITDETMRDIVRELIREKILYLTKDEVPHSVAVVIDSYKEEPEKRKRI